MEEGGESEDLSGVNHQFLYDMRKSLPDKLRDLKKRYKNLYERGDIIQSTYQLASEGINKLIDQISEFEKPDYPIRDDIIKSVINESILYEDILESVEKEKYRDSPYYYFIQELLWKIVDAKPKMDIIIVPSSVEYERMRCGHYLNKNEFTFVLVVNEKLGFLTENLAGLIAHETAHVDYMVNQYAVSIRPERKKVGESLADLLGFITVGPLYTYSMMHWFHVIGVDNSLLLGSHHPSWIARACVINSISDKIWKNQFIREKSKEWIRKLILYLDRLSIQEQMLLIDYIKEGERELDRFINFKIDENVLGSTKRMTKKELVKLGKIYQLNKIAL